MQRKAMDKLVTFAKKHDLDKPTNKKYLDEALSGCRNLVTRERLRARILRAS